MGIRGDKSVRVRKWDEIVVNSGVFVAGAGRVAGTCRRRLSRIPRSLVSRIRRPHPTAQASERDKTRGGTRGSSARNLH